MALPSTDPERAVADAVTSLAERGMRLELSTLDLCFIAALHLKTQSASLVSLTEDQLEDVFANVCQLVEGATTSLKKRATHAIGRLREQRLLVRIDGLGVAKAAEFSPTRLAHAISEHLLEDDVLTSESLTVLTTTLGTTLSAVRDVAGRAGDDAERWQREVTEPLRVTASDLVAGIERRQRGLDQQQERFQGQIRQLLEADWFGAIDRCQSLLHSTSETLRELAELLLTGTSGLIATLQDIHEAAHAAGIEEAGVAAQRLTVELDRIAAWGLARQESWSEYFEYVHRFLREVVRLDPARAIAQRLRDQLAGETGRSFALAIAAAPKIRLLRDIELPEVQEPVKRPKKTRDKEPDDTPPEDPQAALDARVRKALADGADSLALVTVELADESEETEHFVAAGRIADSVARLAEPRGERPRPWVPVSDAIAIEDWTIDEGASDRRGEESKA